MLSNDLLQRYASLLVNYCLYLRPGEVVHVRASYLAEPLLDAVARAVYEAGAIPVFDIEMKNIPDLQMKYASEDQLRWVNPARKLAFEQFDAFLNIRAPFHPGDDEREPQDEAKFRALQEAQSALNRVYFERMGNGSLKRSLCVYPTEALARDAGMSLEDYTAFVLKACYLDQPDPVEKWLEMRKRQQTYVDYLNKSDQIHYSGPNIDMKFSVKGRTWINSDGKANMPSGEVFSAPVEDSVNGWAFFSYPTIYMGKAVEGIRLEVKDGLIVSWSAEKGGEILDKVFSVPGARHWGEVAIGTNDNIQQITRNILFDEKIGGSIHMAVGQSYKQCGGKNESTVHWDMITDMKQGGRITADGQLIYENGRFVI